MDTETPKKRGRPRRLLDLATVEKLAALFCTQAEIAVVLGQSERNLRRSAAFLSAYEKGHAAGKTKLRQLQFDNAKAGNATMQIWLGKQYLGQADSQRIEHSGSVDTGWSVSDLTRRILGPAHRSQTDAEAAPALSRVH